MRIAIAGYCHETNSFCNIPVTQQTIDSNTRRGNQLYNDHAGVRTCIGGFIHEAERLGTETVFAPYVGLGPCGPTVQKAYETARDTIVDELWQAHQEKPLDGIALNLHGAGVAEGYNDLESDLLQAVRTRFGDSMPIAMVLDLHANVSEEMIALSNICVGYKCYPHVDLFEAGCTTFRLLHDMILEGGYYGKALIRLPWHFPSAFGVTLSGAAFNVKQYMQDMVDTDPELLDASFFHGFPYADVPCAGVSVVTVAKTQEAAERCARRIAEYAWNHRQDFTAPLNSAAQAMDLAEKAAYPVVINESSDNPGGGTPGDGTHLLREMLRRNIPGSAYGYIRDPEVVEQAVAAGVGKTISCKLGGKSDSLHGEPIELENAYIKTISDGKFLRKNPMGAGTKCDWGPMVLLVVGNVQIVVSPARAQTMDDGPFFLTGIDWREQRILALKSSHHFKGWWQDKAATIIPCDSPGVHSSDLSTFQFKNLNTGYYPFADAQWK